MAPHEIDPTPDEPGVATPSMEPALPHWDVLDATIRRLLGPGAGILAADESPTTIGRRFERMGVRSTEASRRAYREMLFSAPGIGDEISGVSRYDETIASVHRTGSRSRDCSRSAEPSRVSRSTWARSRSRSPRRNW